MFKKLITSDVAKYIAATLSMLIVFALTLSMGASLASYTKDLGTIATLSLMTTDDNHQQLMLHEGYRFRNNVMHTEPYASSAKLVFGTWNDYHDELGIAGTTATLESFIRTGKAQNAVDCCAYWNRGILAFYNASTKTTYILSAEDRTIYANPNSESLIYFGNQEWENVYGSIWNKTLTEIVFSDKFDTSKVQDFTSFIGRMENLTKITGIKNFDTSSATDMSQMFYYLPNLTTVDGKTGTLDLTNFDTSKVTNMHGMFIALHQYTALDLSSFDNTNLQYVGSFASGVNLKTIYVSEKWKLKDYPLDYDGPETNADGSSNLAYYNTLAFPHDNQDMNGRYYISKFESPGSNSYEFQMTKNPDIYQSAKYANWLYGYFTLKDTTKLHSTFTLRSGSDIRHYFMKDQRWTGTSSYNSEAIILGSWNDYGVAAGGADFSYESFLATPNDTTTNWNGFGDVSKSGNIRSFAKDGKLYILSAGHNTMYLNQSSQQMFALGTGTKDTNTSDGIPKDGPNETITKITLDGVDARYCTNMDGFFSQCRALIQISGFESIGDTSKVTDMSEMFYYNFELASVDLSKLKTDSVKSMYAMFIGCESLTSINFGSANFKSLQLAGNMFNGLTACEYIYVNPSTGHFPTMSLTNTSANANLEEWNRKVFYNCPVLVGHHGDMLADNTTEYNYTYATTNDGGFFTNVAVLTAKLANIDFNLPEDAITGLDLDLDPFVISAMPSEAVISSITITAEENTPTNYTFDSLMFYNENMGIAQQVSVDNLTTFLESCYEDGDELELFITPVYMPLGDAEPEVPFVLQDGYISGLDIGLEPMTVDGPLESFGDLFDFLNWGEDNVPEGYLLDTFMFYTGYMYKEMYIEDAFDFLDAHYADGADTVFNVTPVYMPDPDYIPPEPEVPADDSSADGGSTTEDDSTVGDDSENGESSEGEDVSDSDVPETGDEPADGGSSEGNDPSDTPSDNEASDEGNDEPTDTPSETPSDEPSSGDDGDSGSSDNTSSDTPSDTPVESPETPVETPAAPPVETPVVTPSTGGSDEGSSGSSSGEGSSDSGSSAPADAGSGDASSSGEISE